MYANFCPTLPVILAVLGVLVLAWSCRSRKAGPDPLESAVRENEHLRRLLSEETERRARAELALGAVKDHRDRLQDTVLRKHRELRRAEETLKEALMRIGWLNSELAQAHSCMECLESRLVYAQAYIEQEQHRRADWFQRLMEPGMDRPLRVLQG